MAKIAWRHDLILLLLATAGFVVYSQFQLSFNVSVAVDFSLKEGLVIGQTSDSLQYNLFSGARRLYEHGAKPLAVLLIIWSGVLPYAKLLALAWLHSRIVLGKVRRAHVQTARALLFASRMCFLDVWVVVVVLVTVSLDASVAET